MRSSIHHTAAMEREPAEYYRLEGEAIVASQISAWRSRMRRSVG